MSNENTNTGSALMGKAAVKVMEAEQELIRAALQLAINSAINLNTVIEALPIKQKLANDLARRAVERACEVINEEFKDELRDAAEQLSNELLETIQLNTTANLATDFHTKITRAQRADVDVLHDKALQYAKTLADTGRDCGRFFFDLHHAANQ